MIYLTLYLSVVVARVVVFSFRLLARVYLKVPCANLIQILECCLPELLLCGCLLSISLFRIEISNT